MKALLVEDIEVDTLLLTTMLSKFHCETTLAKNGKEAVDLFLEGKKFAIILCDKDMPVMTGPEVLYLFFPFLLFMKQILLSFYLSIIDHMTICLFFVLPDRQLRRSVLWEKLM